MFVDAELYIFVYINVIAKESLVFSYENEMRIDYSNIKLL